jgi:hypothetical protein
MSVGLKHSHYWENQQLGGEPNNYLGAQVFWFQIMSRGRRPAINPLTIALLLNALRIEDDEEDVLTGML